jgi:hypothetical protein
MNIDISKLTSDQKIALYRQLGIELKGTVDDENEYSFREDNRYKELKKREFVPNNIVPTTQIVKQPIIRKKENAIYNILGTKFDPKKYTNPKTVVQSVDYSGEFSKYNYLEVTTIPKINKSGLLTYNQAPLPLIRKGQDVKLIRGPEKGINKFYGIVYIYIKFNISEDTRQSYKLFKSEGLTDDQIKERVKDIVDNYISQIGPEQYTYAYKYGTNNNIRSNILSFEYASGENVSDSKLLNDQYRLINNAYYMQIGADPTQIDTIFTMPLREVVFSKLPFNIKSNTESIKINCAAFLLIDYIKSIGKLYRRSFKSVYDIALQMNNWTVSSFIFFCDSFDIPLKMCLYTGKTLCKITPKNKLPFLTCIVSNEHIYNITSDELRAIRETFKFNKDKNEITRVVYEKGDLIKNIKDKKILPAEFSISFRIDKEADTMHDTFDTTHKLHINSYTFENVLFTNDERKANCFKLFTDIIIPFPITSKFTHISPLLYLCEINNLWSTNTLMMNDSVSMFNYHSELTDKESQIYTINSKIDKNKAHTYSLSTLDYIPIIDSTCHTLKYNNEPINDYYFYHVVQTDPSKNVKFIKNGWQSGFILNKTNNPKDIIDAYIQPILKSNPFKKVIEQCYKKDPDTMKFVFNKFIGFIQNNTKSESNNIIPIMITNSMKEVSQICHGNESYGYEEIGIDMYSIHKYSKSKDCLIVNNMLPLAIMINNVTTCNVINKINSLYSTKECIITDIKVDSICISHTPIFNINKHIDGPSVFSGWKLEEYQSNKYVHAFPNNKHKFKQRIQLKSIDDYKYGCLYLSAYAGGSKTWTILNKLLPKLHFKTLIISTQYQALTDYFTLQKTDTDKDIDVYVIQKMECNLNLYNSIPNYQNIIIEEGGLMNGWQLDRIFAKCNTEQNIIITGDPKQLPCIIKSVKKHYILSNGLLNYYFDQECHLNGNMRNYYSKQNYDDMFDGKFNLTDYELSKVNKITGNNICFFKNTVAKINKKIVDKMDTVEYNNISICKGIKVLSIGNLKDHDLYKNCPLIVDSFDDTNIHLKSSFDKIFIIPKELFTKENFQHNYAITLYRVQGRSIPENDISFHDFNYIKSNGCYLYVCLSRIQNKFIV